MIQHETGRASVVFGIDENGDQAYTLEIEGIDVFEGWAGMKLMAQFLENTLLNGLHVELGGDDSDDPDA